MSTISISIEEVPISEHPNFHKKFSTWGIIPAGRHPIYDECGEMVAKIVTPENRDNYRPELDGMSLADMWDAEKQDWKIQPPGMEGITKFLRPKTTFEMSIDDIEKKKIATLGLDEVVRRQIAAMGVGKGFK